MGRTRKTGSGKKKKRGATRKGSGRPAWGSLLLGLAIGLAAGLAFYLLRSPVETPPLTHKAEPTHKPAPPREPPPTPPRKDRPRFDFYTLLPQIEVEIPQEKLDEALRALPKVNRGGTYILQCGSFRDYADADELKARLALLGIEASIQTVVIKNGESWHRVRIGPFKGLEAVKPVRRKLKRHDIDFVVIRMGDE